MCDFLISMTHNVGVRVSATMPDRVTEMAMVMANCRYITPARPPMKPTGMNTAHSTSTMAMTAPVTSCMALAVAWRGVRSSVSSMRAMFSMTTMASSTTMPMASTRAKSVRVLMEKPSA